VIRLFVAADLGRGARIEPSPEQAHYLLNVMRLAQGEEVLLFNGRDGEWRSRLAEAGKRRCALEPEALTRPQAPSPDLELVMALVKRARLETVVEKAAELGCRRVRLAITRRTNADHARTDRLQAIAVEAAEQTGRLDVPAVEAPEKLDRLIAGWDPARRLMFCDEAATAPLPALDALRSAPGGAWAVLIGPEGGFDPAERERLLSLPFVVPATLGPRILRADTAAITALALWQAVHGDWVESP
jgi:16S rRNA (uracil1498-N3)-methyltransferase